MSLVHSYHGLQRLQHARLGHPRGGDFDPLPGGSRGSFGTPRLAKRTQGAQHRDTERARWYANINKHKKMTDHVAEHIELEFKAATAPQPPH